MPDGSRLPAWAHYAFAVGRVVRNDTFGASAGSSIIRKGQKMMRRVAMTEGRLSELAAELSGAGRRDSGTVDDLSDLQSEENVRLVAFCEAPALLWRSEPFGMIA
jgi:hypothetical protein